VEHLGEAVFRDDLDNSVLDLGDLLTHEGPALQAQKEAARIFGAEKTYFVLNGTSTSNKVALSALVTDGDLVLFDRNNHKAAHHGALMIAGGIPVYVPTVRNAWGLIGPMPWDALDEKTLRDCIRTHPLVKDPDAWRRPRPFRVAVIEQCTYDGTIYSAEMILRRIGHLCDYILFDEAWAGFMKFHPLYAGRFAMGLSDLGPDAPGIIATQSTHKQLASFSQASQIHVKDGHIRGQKRRVEHRRFNESFHAARVHVAILPAVRLARRRRADDEGTLGRGPVGRHDPARHRAAQEDPHRSPRVRGEGKAREPLVLRALRA
jgi:ornithine decarboxylase